LHSRLLTPEHQSASWDSLSERCKKSARWA
jgi:hypothetical protein